MFKISTQVFIPPFGVINNFTAAACLKNGFTHILDNNAYGNLPSLVPPVITIPSVVKIPNSYDIENDELLNEIAHAGHAVGMVVVHIRPVDFMVCVDSHRLNCTTLNTTSIDKLKDLLPRILSISGFHILSAGCVQTNVMPCQSYPELCTPACEEKNNGEEIEPRPRGPKQRKVNNGKKVTDARL